MKHNINNIIENDEEILINLKENIKMNQSSRITPIPELKHKQDRGEIMINNQEQQHLTTVMSS